MADIETADGAEGAAREWLARAARAPRGKAWIADGIISERWAPASPSGALDAFVWRAPQDRLSAPPPASAPPPTPPPMHAPAPLATPEPPLVAPTPAAPQPRQAAPPIAASAPPRPLARPMIAPTIAPDDPGPLADDEAPDGGRRFAGD
jgi:HemY protein